MLGEYDCERNSEVGKNSHKKRRLAENGYGLSIGVLNRLQFLPLGS